MPANYLGRAVVQCPTCGAAVEEVPKARYLKNAAFLLSVFVLPQFLMALMEPPLAYGLGVILGVAAFTALTEYRDAHSAK